LVGSPLQTGGRFCCFARFSEVVGLKMSDQGDIWGDPKGKSISRGEKRRMEAEARGPILEAKQKITNLLYIY
jgi:hypothetical protein